MAEAVLLTGASSFTGLWIAEALAAQGFEVVAPLLRARGDYEGERLVRVQRLEAACDVHYATSFGSPEFHALIRGRAFAALAHHAADVTGYRDPDFDALGAFQRNTAGALPVFERLAEHGVRAVIVTGTVFEAGEGGVADEPLAVTPYGLSKTLSSIAYRHFADWTGLRFGRFVIPSPYGVYEQQRSFPAYLFRSWLGGETPTVRTPLYLRDHLPAPLLGQAYAAYMRRLLAQPTTPEAHRPSGWVATQGEFARKLAVEAAARLGRACPLELAEQTVVAEPLRRTNGEPVAGPSWDEARFFDEYVSWYAG